MCCIFKYKQGVKNHPANKETQSKTSGEQKTFEKAVQGYKT